ncbi:MAG: tRNA epoxyqueuosine(34) reductase QueG [Eubacterium sp.]|nr:tRNA epoxyqueuosine(34) reductase QueG [Eubacterium sp.]
MLTEQTIRRLAADCGIEEIGFHDGSPMTEWLAVLKARREAGRITDFENVPPEERIDFEAALPGVKAVVAAAFPVAPGATPPEDMEKRGKMASVAWGLDYHRRVAAGLVALAEKIVVLAPQTHYKVYVDNSRLLDRASAFRAGLGFFGKNNLLINPRYGSFFFIGQLLLDQPVAFEKALPKESLCGDCDKCLKACPGGALGQGFTLEPDRCISYLTQKKTLAPEEEALIKDYLYGCDICQRCCPFNEKSLACSQEAEVEKIYPRLEELMAMSNKAFKAAFGDSAAGWRGKRVLIRNAAIIKNRRKKCDKK